MPNSLAIDQAFTLKLSGDAALLSLMRDGIRWEYAPGCTQYVLLSVVDARDEGDFAGRAMEEILYEVKISELSTLKPQHADAAFARVDALLDRGDLQIPGYTLMKMEREARDRHRQPDQVDPDIWWTYRTGQYRVIVSVNAGTE